MALQLGHGEVHNRGSLSDCVQYFGIAIFTLWKLVMLQKRVLLYAPPPVGPACDRSMILSPSLNFIYYFFEANQLVCSVNYHVWLAYFFFLFSVHSSRAVSTWCD